MQITYIIRNILLIILLHSIYSYALIYTLPKNGNKLIGKNFKITIPKNNIHPLEYFAEKYQLGLSNLLEINPNTDVYLPQAESEIIIPHQLILPNTPHEGIIINSAEMRLYFYPKNSNKIIVFPIGIGEIGNNTPFNWVTSVQRKKHNPVWIPTKKIRDEYLIQGTILPKIIASGPHNPMGLYALYIGKLYAIHGTNANFGIGLRISHGCIRLRADDIKYLFQNVPLGTRVQFINEPVKITQEKNGNFYIEVHQPLSLTKEEFYSNQPNKIQLSNATHNMLKNKNINPNLVKIALEQRLGIPVNITKKPS
uniref:L,D-transpeptidase n=1 Tax=endosymbiont of Polyrhachis macropus TaxID=698794 RepID=D2XN84_9ENTR|nr:L,D-transpeptidase [endosymbiont of Polyrhachis macropus]